MTMLIPIRDHNPTRRTPLVTWGLIAVNIWAFLKFGVSEETVHQFGAIPCDVASRCDFLSTQLEQRFPQRTSLTSIVTSMFMHGSLLHLGGNMLYLWVFGNNVEDRLGHVRYLVFYLVTGVAAAASHILVDSASVIPIVGASGAVAGVLGGYLVMFPRARVTSLVPIFLFWPVQVSAKFLLVMWFVLQVFSGVAGLGAQQGGGVAFFAHVGGFVAGYLIVKAMNPPKPVVVEPQLDRLPW
ncbi:MAG TPA: rhomboid family intramembrane serine protease [Actinomycetota bacterium]|nr:rhomboid family intramembrane serine protease [Actinomycetota bacterium]